MCAARVRGERGAGSKLQPRSSLPGRARAAPAAWDTVDLKRSTRGSVLATPRPGPAVGRGPSESAVCPRGAFEAGAAESGLYSDSNAPAGPAEFRITRSHLFPQLRCNSTDLTVML